MTKEKETKEKKESLEYALADARNKVTNANLKDTIPMEDWGKSKFNLNPSQTQAFLKTVGHPIIKIAGTKYITTEVDLDVAKYMAKQTKRATDRAKEARNRARLSYEQKKGLFKEKNSSQTKKSSSNIF